VADTVQVGSGPLGIALTADGRFAYVANRQPFNVTAPGTVSVIDTATHGVVATIPVGENPTSIAIAAPVPSACAGDCDDDGKVSVDELIRGVDMALGTLAVNACAAFDQERDGVVSIAELITAVSNALSGCP
jgi:YVTN family beta-propeller protein